MYRLAWGVVGQTGLDAGGRSSSTSYGLRSLRCCAWWPLVCSDSSRRGRYRALGALRVRLRGWPFLWRRSRARCWGRCRLARRCCVWGEQCSGKGGGSDCDRGHSRDRPSDRRHLHRPGPVPPRFSASDLDLRWSTHRRQRPAVLTIRNTRVASARDRNKPLVCVSLAAEPPPTTSSP
jgi:hypothetical protein